MTIQQTTAFFNGGAASGSGLTRLRMTDEIYTSRQSAGREAGLGALINQRYEFTPLPRPRGPRRLAPARTS